MKKKLFAAAACMVGLAVQAQQVIFLDTFNTGDTNDISVDYVVRQSNGLVTADYVETNPNVNAIATNALRKTGGGNIVPDINFAPYLAGKSFEFSADIRMDNTNNQWLALSMLSANEDARGKSPLSFYVRGTDTVGASAIVTTADATGTNLHTTVVNFSDSDQYHNFKIVVTEAGAVDRVQFQVDGEAADLGDYAFAAFTEDTTRKLEIISMNDIDGFVDNLTLATRPTYAFFDSFDRGNTTDVNLSLVSRQAGGLITSTYTESSDGSNLITGDQLSRIAGGTLDLDTNLVSYMVGNDFELSIDTTLVNTGSQWAAFYVMSATEPARGSARMGFHQWGPGNGTAFTVYSGTGAAGANYTGTGVTTAALNVMFQSAFGINYDKAAKHTIKLISTEGPTNTYDFVIDGIVVLEDLPYAFGEDTTRKLGFTATVTTTYKGVLYDNLSLLPIYAMAENSYAQWAIDNSLIGDDALSSADPDVDGMDNLLEYALGGNPSTNDAAAKLPVFGIQNVGGTNWFGYVYTRRLDAAARGLDYGVIVNDSDLVLGSWTNIGTSAEFSAGPIDADFESVTNVLSTTESKKFVSLEVIEN
jgi:hypothetical protein